MNRLWDDPRFVVPVAIVGSGVLAFVVMWLVSLWLGAGC